MESGSLLFGIESDLRSIGLQVCEVVRDVAP